MLVTSETAREEIQDLKLPFLDVVLFRLIYATKGQSIEKRFLHEGLVLLVLSMGPGIKIGFIVGPLRRGSQYSKEPVFHTQECNSQKTSALSVLAKFFQGAKLMLTSFSVKECL